MPHISQKDFRQCYDAIVRVDTFLGLGLDEVAPPDISEEIEDLIQKRESARVNKQWELSDSIRKQIESSGYVLEDTPSGPRIRKI